MEKMNIECDKRAGERRKQATKDRSHIFEASQIGYWQLHFKDEPVLVQLKETIRLSIQEYDAFDYWTKKNYNSISEQGFYNIDWEATEKAMNTSSRYKRHFIAKHATGHCGVGKMMKLWGFRAKDNCPRCKKTNETALHVITCQHSTAKETWDNELGILRQWLRHHKTDPEIETALLYNIRKWRKCGGIYGHHYFDAPVTKAIRDQKEIGWDHFMLGRISLIWSVLQGKYYKRLHLRTTGEKWAELLIQEIWRIHCAIWNQRNEILHGTGNHKVLGTKDFEKEIRKEISKGYAFLLSTEHYLFKGINMDIVRKWTADKKQKWLLTVQAARYTSTLRHQESLPSRENMKNWLKG